MLVGRGVGPPFIGGRCPACTGGASTTWFLSGEKLGCPALRISLVSGAATSGACACLPERTNRIPTAIKIAAPTHAPGRINLRQRTEIADCSEVATRPDLRDSSLVVSLRISPLHIQPEIAA